jgi:hypothetical protein
VARVINQDAHEHDRIVLGVIRGAGGVAEILDAKFVTTIKELLRTGRDWHVQSYLRQYLETLEQQRA